MAPGTQIRIAIEHVGTGNLTKAQVRSIQVFATRRELEISDPQPQQTGYLTPCMVDSSVVAMTGTKQ